MFFSYYTYSFEVKSPNLMDACHGYQQRVSIHSFDVPRTRERLYLRILVAFTIEAFSPSAYHCQNFLLSEIDLSNSMVLSVAKVHEVHVVSVYVAHALRVMEACLFICAVNQAYLPIPNRSHTFKSLFIDKDNAIIASIRYQDEVMLQSFLLFYA